MGDGRAELALGLGLLRIYVNPLVIERGVGEKVDALLRQLYVV